MGVEGRFTDYTLSEAIAIAKRYDPGDKVPSLSRVLLAHIAKLEAEVVGLTSSREFYARRCEALQSVQDKMRDPERKAVCDILANGSTNALAQVKEVCGG